MKKYFYWLMVCCAVSGSSVYGQQAGQEPQPTQDQASKTLDATRINGILADIDKQSAGKYNLVKEYSLPPWLQLETDGAKLLQLGEKLKEIAQEPGQDRQVQLLVLAAAKLIVPSTTEPQSKLSAVTRDIDRIQHQSLDDRRNGKDQESFQKNLRQLFQTLDMALQLQRESARQKSQPNQDQASKTLDATRINGILADIDKQSAGKYNLVKEYSLPPQLQLETDGVKLLQLSEKLKEIAQEPGQDRQVQLLVLAAVKLIVPSTTEPQSKLRAVTEDIDRIQHQSLDERRNGKDRESFQKNLHRLSQTLDMALQLQQESAAAENREKLFQTINLILKRQ